MNLNNMRDSLIIRPNPGGVIAYPCGCRIATGQIGEGDAAVYPSYISIDPACEKHHRLVIPR